MAALRALQPRRELLTIMRRFTIVRGETRRLPNTFRHIKVVNGCAWVSYAGQDMILIPGDTAEFNQNADFPVISAMGHTPLVIEVPGR